MTSISSRFEFSSTNIEVRISVSFILQFHSWIKILGDGTIVVEKKAKKKEASAAGELRVKTPETCL